MKILLALVVGVAIGAAAFWIWTSDSAKSEIRSRSAEVQSAAQTAVGNAQEQLKVLRIRPQDIKDELSRSGQVVRRKAEQAGQALADATSDGRITAAIKGKLVADSHLSALSISVNTTAGVVTLAGFVSSPEEISRAMLLAMEVEGVKEVVSTLQVSQKNGKR